MIRIPVVVMGLVAYYDVELRFERYFTGNIAIALGPEDDLLGMATVNLSNATPSEGCVFIKNWSENQGCLDSLTKAGVIEPTGRTVQTGYVVAHEARLLITPEEDD